MLIGPLRSFRSLAVALGAALVLAATSPGVHAANEPLAAATAGLWSEGTAPSPAVGARSAIPLRYRLVTLDGGRFAALAQTAPREEGTSARASDVIVPLPLPDGGIARFRIVETAVMAPELAAQFPDIRTWLGHDVDDPASTVRLDWTPLGFHAMVLSPSRGRYFIDPWSLGDTQNYLSYYGRDYVPAPGSRPTRLPPVDVLGKAAAKALAQALGPTAQKSSGTQLRTYRLAVAATVEYSAKFGGTVPNVQAAIVTAINRVNGIYETEVAVRMQLVANNSSLIYTAEPDPYTNDDGTAMLGQNQTNVTTVIGSANYDIGHVFSTGGGGIAGLGVVCSAGNKARGVTGSSNPVGDGFYVDYVAHEIGHQFNAEHSFNGNADNCGGGNRNASTAYEPGSGSTIMGYAGICGAQDLQAHSDPYFHSVSFDEIVTFTTEGGGSACGSVTSTGNTLPSATVPLGGFTVPARTPFALTGAGGDADGDAITYNWEEYDLGSAGAPGRDTVAPFFRSWPASTGPTRIFPRLSNLLAGTLATGEVLPNITRALNFRMTVRDNRAGGGGVVYAPFTFNVTTTAGPFQVTAPNTNVTWAGGSTQTVTWNVANTASAPVSCANVDILLSTDGGNTFPTVLAAATANDGSAPVTLPAVTTTTARVMVACSTSIFFDISNTNFAIGGAPPPGPAVTTGSASAITATGATLNGTVSSNGATTTVTFDFGTSTSYGGSAVAAQSPLAAGASGAAVSAVVSGLTCNTLYHFRAAGTNANGAQTGADATFTTSACALAPTTTALSSDNNPAIAGTPVTFTASVTGTAPTGSVTFRNGAATIGACSAVALSGGGNTRAATCVVSNLAVGTYSITARYNGGGGNAESVSSPLSQAVQNPVPGSATIVTNPYGPVSVTGATLNGNTISNFTSNVVIQLGGTPGAPGTSAQIDFQGLSVGSGNVVTLRSGAAGQAVLLRAATAAASVIDGTLRAEGGGGGVAPLLRVANPNGITVGGLVEGLAGVELSALGAASTQGQLVRNTGTIDGGASLVVKAAGIRGGGAFKGNAMLLSMFGNANNPVNGNDFLANGLQLFPSTGNAVDLTLNPYGPAPLVMNLKINGNGKAWMPSSWPVGTALPQNNNPLAPDGVRPPGTPAPGYGGGSMILQSTGTLALVDGGTHDFVFPGAIVLKSGGALDLNGVLVNQGWTGNGQSFQGIFLEAPSIASSTGNLRLYTNFPNWVNFSTLPQTPVRAFTLAKQPDGSETFVAADDSVPHQNTYSVIQGIAAAGGCWLCAVNTQPVNVYGP